MSESRILDERYLDWLYGLVAPVTVRNPARSYRKLANHLFKKVFNWTVPNDDNRIEDGRELRYEFLELFVIDDDDPEWVDLEVSVLEVLIALSRRASYESGAAPDFWFWRFMDHLDIRQYTDAKYSWEDIDAALDVFIDRKYTRHGVGGLFPLYRGSKNQRTTELWYQMAAYLLENNEY